MNKVSETLKMKQFEDRILLMWTYSEKGLICIRDRRTGQTKIIKVNK